MMLMRELAVRISGVVVRRASPGCNVGAEGLDREAAVIPSDWAALRWSLGSVRVLFNFREARLASLADVPSAAQKFAELKRRGGPSIVFVALFLIGFPLQIWWDFSSTPNRSVHIGCGMAVFSSICIGISMLIERSRLYLSVPPSEDIRACAQFYKAELERNLEESRLKQAAKAFVMIGWCVGLILAWSGFRMHPIGSAFLTAVVVFVLSVSLQTPRNAQERIRERIERLNEFLLLPMAPHDR
jgi:hypothetical protein